MVHFSILVALFSIGNCGLTPASTVAAHSHSATLTPVKKLPPQPNPAQSYSLIYYVKIIFFTLGEQRKEEGEVDLVCLLFKACKRI